MGMPEPDPQAHALSASRPRQTERRGDPVWRGRSQWQSRRSSRNICRRSAVGLGVAAARSRRHNLMMPPRRSADTRLDLFSVAPAKAVASPGNPNRDNAATHSRHLLPKDLAGALKHLDHAELDALLAAVTTEAERRGRLRPSPAKKSPPRKAEGGLGSLTSGQLNAVRAPLGWC